MRPPLSDGTILITGPSSGIGKQIALQLGPVAKTLILVARRADRLDVLKSELIAANPELVVDVRPCDLGDVAATDAMFDGVIQGHGHVDVLINNAGFGDIGLFHMNPLQKSEQMIKVNIVALTRLCHKVLPGMVARGSGGILNVSSGYGLTWSPFFAAYCGTKHYVTAFTESLRAELAGTGVVVSQVCPGPVKTEFLAVAGNPIGVAAPGFAELSAEACARKALKAFSKGKALKIPGFWISVTMIAARLTPRWALRLLYGVAAKRMRKKIK